MGCYITFNEPMDLSTITNTAAYVPSVATAVSSATVVYNAGGTTTVQLVFAAAIPAGTIQVTTAAKDLSGNSMSTVLAESTRALP